MNGKIHVAVGVSTLAALCIKYPTGFDFFDVTILPQAALATAALGSYAPDWDLKPMHYSQGKKGVKKKVAQARTKVVNKVTGGHRGITHTLLFPAILTYLLVIINEYLSGLPSLASLLQSLLFGFWFGWVMHIFADLFNGKGVPLFWPLMQSKVHIMDVDSEGWQPWAWLFIYVAIVFYYLFRGELGL